MLLAPIDNLFWCNLQQSCVVAVFFQNEITIVTIKITNQQDLEGWVPQSTNTQNLLGDAWNVVNATFDVIILQVIL